MGSTYQSMQEFLKKRGIQANEIGNGRLVFSVNGLNFIFEVNSNDPHFLRFALPKINRQDIQLENFEQHISQLNRNYKVTKIVKDLDNSLLILADAFVYSLDNIEPLFVRLIQASTDMINDYRTIENNVNGTIKEQ